MPGRRVITVITALVGVAAVGGWLVLARGQDAPKKATGTGSTCRISPKLVPTCGVILGVATNPNTGRQLQAVEKGMSRKFDMVYRFHDLDDEVPTDDERSLVKAGVILHVSIDSRIYQPPQHSVPWTAVAAGEYDGNLERQARGIASLTSPVFVTFDHEPDQLRRTGTPANFITGWRHVHDLFIRAGALNAVWVWVTTGYQPAFPSAGELWPGNEFVDWISWEAYNSSGCLSHAIDRSFSRSFAASALPFYTWLKANGARYNIDTGKPMIISEAASVVYPEDPQATAEWYTPIPDVLALYPQIHGIGLWDRPATTQACQYQFDAIPQIRGAVSQMSSRLPALRRDG